MIGLGGEGQAEALGVGDDLELFDDFGCHAVHLQVDGGGLDEPNATETPAGDFVCGLEFLDKCFH